MALQDRTSSLIPVYPYRLPVSFIRGKGIWLWDTETETPYLDALSGRGVSNLGHSHPRVIHALKSQVEKVIHTSNLYRIPQQEELATTLCEQFDMARAFFSNSGAESIEAALKIAYRHGKQRSIQNPVILTLQGSYHGRTLAALNVSQGAHLISEKIALGCKSKKDSIVAIPLNDIKALYNTIDQYKKRIIAILIEPILGDGGIRACSYEFLQMIRRLCDNHNYLMIADEIQTGLCRTGPLAAYEKANIKPDIIALAKALGNGFPIGAYLVNERTKDLLNGYHGSTFAGNPLGCTAALSVMEALHSENISTNVQRQGAYLKKELQKQLNYYPMVRNIRGEGLMLGIELDHPCTAILETALHHKLLFDVVSTNTLRLLPPLIITKEEVNELVKRLLSAFQEYTATRYKYSK